MLNQYILRNGLSAVAQYDKRNHIRTENKTKLVLTDDLRGGVLGKEYDVVAIKEPQDNYFSDWIPENVVDPTFFDRGRLEPDFADAEEAAQYRDDALEAAMYTIQKGEIPMGSETPYENNRDGFKTVHYYNGQAVGNISDREIFFIIQELQAELKALKKLGKDKSKAVKAHNKRINRDINKLMTELDSRH